MGTHLRITVMAGTEAVQGTDCRAVAARLDDLRRLRRRLLLGGGALITLLVLLTAIVLSLIHI